MDQSLIAWMLSGGERFESREDQRQRTHRLALREVTVTSRTESPFGGLFARWTSRTPAPTMGVATDCCAA